MPEQSLLKIFHYTLKFENTLYIWYKICNLVCKNKDSSIKFSKKYIKKVNFDKDKFLKNEKSINCPICQEKHSFKLTNYIKYIGEVIKAPICQKCGYPTVKIKDKIISHCYCLGDQHSFQYARAVGALKPYSSTHTFTIMVRSIKNNKYYIHALGFLLIWYLENISPALKNFDFLIACPITNEKLEKRKYNQSFLLASIVAEHYKKECKEILKYRQGVEVKSHRNLSRSKRFENIQDTMEVTEKLSGEKILYIDDVNTTCSHFEEASKKLIAAGAGEVYGLFLARTLFQDDYDLVE
ncbi:MAG: ComF family protein [Candidatus Helarchaeota archaeon]